jgi:predicted SAM-dependent methyltransferase
MSPGIRPSQATGVEARNRRLLRSSVLHQRYKDLCFFLIAKATWPNYWLKKAASASRFRNNHRLDLHLGSGTKYLPGFVNIDANPLQKMDMWLDVRCGLPFASGSVDSIYSTHMIEHLYPDELDDLLRECARVLKSGHGIRIVVPSLSNAIVAFQQERREWFYDSYPRHFDSLGGRFSNFVFCDGQHRTAFDLTYLDEVLRKAGFREVAESAEGESRLYEENVPGFEPFDKTDLPHSVFVEAFK